MFIDTNFESPRSTSSLASVVSNSGSSSDDSSSGYSSATTLKSNYAVALNRTARLPLNHITEAQQLECKEKFINYLGLYATGKIIKKEKIVRPKPLTYAKFFNVDISSPLGKLIIRTGEMGVNDRIDINATELAIPERKGLRSEGADTLVTLDDKEDFPITYLKKAHEKLSRAGKRIPHQYCFNTLQRKIRAQILEKGNAFLIISSVLPILPILFKDNLFKMQILMP